MSTIARGMKRRCGSCDSAYYDLQRVPILCPKCGAVFDATAKSKLASTPRAPKANVTRTKFNAGPKAAARVEPNNEAEKTAKPDEDTGAELDEIDPAEDEGDEEADAPSADEDSAEEPEGDDEIERGLSPAIS
jgi:uncharacterized protein (TIGR02300 family)